MALFSKKWLKGMGKTRRGILDKITDMIQGKNRVQDDVLESLEQILIECDIGVDTAIQIVDQARESFRHSAVHGDEIRDFVKQKIIDLLQHEIETTPSGMLEKPHVILVVGVNGTGKTTSIGKLAYRFRRQGMKALLAGSDTFRAAAGEQLEVWETHRSGCDTAGPGCRSCFRGF